MSCGSKHGVVVAVATLGLPLTGEGRLPATVALTFSVDETADLGRDTASPVSDDSTPEESIFTAVVHWVQIDLGTDDHDHLISPEERLRIAMARQ
jgi:hypothetical protein